MSTVHLHLKNLPPDAVNLDIRRFFIDFDIPEGGVQIVGGPEGEAFVTFNNYEDLLKATCYGKRPFLGRQLSLNLVNSFEIEKIIETIKYELAANVTPQAMERSPPRQMSPPRRMSPPRQMSPRRELPHAWARSPLLDFSPPRELPWVAGHPGDLPWQKRPRAVTPPWSREDSIFAGLESKRMRLSDRGLDDGRYLSSRDDSRADRDVVGSQERETLRMELEKERQRNQDIEDELRRNKERIERLERGIVEKDIDTMVRDRPVVEEPRRSQMMDPRDELDRRQPEEPRYQGKEIRPIPQEPPRFDRFDRPEPRFEQSPPAARYGRPEEAYDRNDTRYRGPSPQRPGIDDRRRERSPIRNQPQEMRDQGRQGRRPNSPDRRKDDMINYSPPGYVMVSNLDNSVTYKEVRRFFDGYQIARGGIILKQIPNRNTSTAYIKFLNLDDALNCDKKDNHRLRGREVHIEMISPVDYDAERNPEEVQEKHIFSPPPRIKPLSKDQVGPVSNVRKLTQYPAPAREQRPQLMDGTYIALPYTGGVQQALFFIILKFLPDDATACSVWEEFGGPLGRSLGVLMLDEKKEKPCKNWYVAFENYDDRNAEIPLHEKARACKDKSVYRKLANISAESKLFRSTHTGEDVGISPKEQGILKQRFLLKEFEKQQKGKSDREFEDEQLLINRISRSLFPVKQKESLYRERVVPDQSQSYYLRLVRLPADVSACEVRSWFKGSAGSCSSVILTSRPDEELGKLKIGYVAFNDRLTRNAEKAKYDLSRKLGERAALRTIAHVSFFPDSEILRSTDTVDEVMTEEDLKALQKEWLPRGLDMGAPGTEKTQRSLPSVSSGPPRKAEKEPLYILQIKGIKPEMSCSNMWQWFGGRKGSAEGVTLMETDGGCIAFVVFRDAEKCTEAMKKHEKSETITEKQMLKKMACCSPKHMIFRSSLKGPNGMMSKTEKADLMKRHSSEMKKDSEDGKKKSDTTSGEQNASSTSKPAKKNSNEKDPKEAGHPKPTGNAEMNQPGTKYFLKISDLAEDATACEVWSWFGGPTGSSPGVTLVHRFKEMGDSKCAFVEFTDWKSRNEVKSKYPNTKNPNERQVLRTLALCGPETEILQSTESGVDCALTVEERDIIRNSRFPDGLSPSSDQKPQSKPHIQRPTIDRPRLLQRKEKYEYIRLTDLKPDVSACTINAQHRPCRGVTLVKNVFGQAVLAFVAFNKKTNRRATTWQNSRDRELASLELDFEIYENTMKSKDRKITPSERQEFLDYVQDLNSRENNWQRK